MSTLQHQFLDYILRCGVCGDALSEIYAGANLHAKGKTATVHPASNENEIQIKSYLMECGHFTCRKHLDFGEQALTLQSSDFNPLICFCRSSPICIFFTVYLTGPTAIAIY